MNMLKKGFFMLLLMFGVLTFSQAQRTPPTPPNPPRPPAGLDENRIKSLKIAHLTERLNLSSEDATKFWPIYNQFEDKKLALQKEIAKLEVSLEMDDKEANAFILKSMENAQKLVNLRQEQINALKGVLSIQQLAMLQISDRDFGRMVLTEVQGRRFNRGK
ncbi:MAG: hypothetical protein RJA52_1213 [Bacteroidota bacterium]